MLQCELCQDLGVEHFRFLWKLYGFRKGRSVRQNLGLGIFLVSVRVHVAHMPFWLYQCLWLQVSRLWLLQCLFNLRWLLAAFTQNSDCWLHHFKLCSRTQNVVFKNAKSCVQERSLLCSQNAECCVPWRRVQERSPERTERKKSWTRVLVQLSLQSVPLRICVQLCKSALSHAFSPRSAKHVRLAPSSCIS